MRYSERAGNEETPFHGEYCLLRSGAGTSQRTTVSLVYETRLLDRFRQGDADALNILFEMYSDRVYAYAMHLLGVREDAEEVTSEAFVRAFQYSLTFRGEGSFRGWLFRIVRNLCIDTLRQPRLLSLEVVSEEDQSLCSSETASTDTALIVRDALRKISEEHRMLLLLCDVEEWDAQEVADMQQRTLAATKSMLYRARRALREQLKSALREEGKRNGV